MPFCRPTNSTKALKASGGTFKYNVLFTGGSQSTSCLSYLCTHTHTHPFNGPLSGTTRVGPYQKGKNYLDFTEARDSEWQWHQLGYMQLCTSPQADNHARTPPLSLLQAGCPSAAQPTASKHWRHQGGPSSTMYYLLVVAKAPVVWVTYAEQPINVVSVTKWRMFL